MQLTFAYCVTTASPRRHPLGGIANLLGGIKNMVVIEMRIARGRLVIGMAKQPSDHRQGPARPAHSGKLNGSLLDHYLGE